MRIMFGRLGGAAEMAADSAFARSVTKYDYNDELQVAIGRFDQCIIEASQGRTDFNINDVIHVFGAGGAEKLNQAFTIMGEDKLWIADQICSLWAALTVQLTLDLINSGLSHDRTEATMWLAAHPDYQPAPCGCKEEHATD